MMKEIMNIQETLASARECGIPLTEYTLRRALKSGALPCRIVGRTYFISWTNVMRWLMCEDGADNTPTSFTSPSTIIQPVAKSGIRRISV